MTDDQRLRDLAAHRICADFGVVRGEIFLLPSFLMAQKLCSRCQERPRVSRAYCGECKAAYMRLHREKVAFMRSQRAAHEADEYGGKRCGVYFLECHGLVKIGMALDVKARRSQIQTANPFPVHPLGFIHEPMPAKAEGLERALHVQFCQDRFRGEWFRHSEALRAFIDSSVGAWPIGLGKG